MQKLISSVSNAITNHVEIKLKTFAGQNMILQIQPPVLHFGVLQCPVLMCALYGSCYKNMVCVSVVTGLLVIKIDKGLIKLVANKHYYYYYYV